MKKIIVFSWVVATVVILIFFPEYTEAPIGWYGLYEEIMMLKYTKRACNSCGVGFARINKYQMKLLALFSVCLAAIVLLMSLGPKEYQEFFFNIFIGFALEKISDVKKCKYQFF